LGRTAVICAINGNAMDLHSFIITSVWINFQVLTVFRPTWCKLSDNWTLLLSEVLQDL
jgi:hypothetical protein